VLVVAGGVHGRAQESIADRVELRKHGLELLMLVAAASALLAFDLDDPSPARQHASAMMCHKAVADIVPDDPAIDAARVGEVATAASARFPGHSSILRNGADARALHNACHEDRAHATG
jgi:hypothetical protein